MRYGQNDPTPATPVLKKFVAGNFKAFRFLEGLFFVRSNAIKV
jgi:hypothetical protein